MVFGVDDHPRTLVGLQSRRFEELDPATVTSFLNEHFAPEIEWYQYMHESDRGEFGLIYVERSRERPVICTKAAGDGQYLREGEIYYRYRGRSQAIRYPELRAIIEERRLEEQRLWMHHMKQISRIGVQDAGVFDLASGKVYGSGGSFVIDESLLDRVSFIREGGLAERNGAPAVKIIGEAQSIKSGLLPPIRPVYRTRVIRAPDIVKAFLDNAKVTDPIEYVRQICFEASAFLPVYYFLKRANLTLAKAVGLVGGVQSRSPAKKKLIARLTSEDDLSRPIPSETTHTGPRKHELRRQILVQDIEESLGPKDVRYALQAIRTLRPNDVSQRYLRGLLKTWFDCHYERRKPNVADDLRRAVCYLDWVLNRKACLDGQPM